MQSKAEKWYVGILLLLGALVGLVLFSGAFIGLIFALTGCATTAPQASVPPPKYQLLLSGSIDGAAFQGTGIGSASAQHSITIKSSIAVDYFTVQSCHRSVQFNGIIQVPWYDWSGDNKSFTWAYDEAPTIEDSGDCILRFCAFSNTVGQAPVSCAIVDFKSPKYTLPGTNICNGASGPTTGTAVCHTQVGLIERFQFQEPVGIAPQVVDPTGKTAPYWIKDQCVGKFLDDAQTLFEYQMPENECVIIFDSKKAPHRRAKLTVLPYDLPKYGGN